MATRTPTSSTIAEEAAQATHSRNAGIQILAEMIKDIRVAMLTTVDVRGKLTSRPMANQNSKFDGRIWFFTKTDSSKIQNIETDQHVNVSYCDPESDRFVSISGFARRIDDRAKANELWAPILEEWFPDGVDDPELTLLAVDAESADIWDSPGNFMQLCF